MNWRWRKTTERVSKQSGREVRKLDIIHVVSGITNKNKSLGALVFVAFSYALMSVISRWLNLGFQPFTQVCLRVFGAFLLTIIIFRRNIRYHNILKTPKSDWAPLLTMGVLGYGVFVYFITMGALNASLLNVSVILATVPFLSYLLSLIFLKVKFNFNALLLALFSLIGVSIIASKSLVPNISGFGKGEVFVMIAALLMATYSISRKMISAHLNNQEITIIVITLAFLTTFVLAMLSGEKLIWSRFTIPIVVVGLVIGSVLNIACTFLESFSFQHLEVVLGNQILLLENLFSVILGYFLYKEVLDIYQLIGGLIIVGSLYLNNRYSE